MVAKLDRLSRSVVDAGKLLAEAQRRGFNIIVLDFGLDLSTPQGELVANNPHLRRAMGTNQRAVRKVIRNAVVHRVGVDPWEHAQKAMALGLSVQFVFTVDDERANAE